MVPHDRVASENTVLWANFGLGVDGPVLRLEKMLELLPKELFEVMVRLFDLRFVRLGLGKVPLSLSEVTKTEPRDEAIALCAGDRVCFFGEFRMGTSKSLSTRESRKVPIEGFGFCAIGEFREFFRKCDIFVP